MKIEIVTIHATLARVTFAPNILERLLGEQIEDRYAIALPSLPSGSAAWFWDHNSRPVPHRIERMINEQYAREERKRRAG